MKKHLLLASLLALSACATLTAESDQVITIETNPKGASCEVMTSENRWTLDQTPGTVVVKRAFEPLNVLCTGPGGERGSTSIEAQTRGRAYGNILLLGIPALVDASTGKGYVYSPDHISLNLTVQNPAPAPAY